MTPRPPAVIAFDLMDTVVHDPYREALEAATRLPLDQLFRHRDPTAYPRFEIGEIDEATYWQVFERAGIDVDVAAFHRTRRAGYRFLPGMPELLDDLAGVVRLVGATNYPDWIRELVDGLLAGRFEAVHASCDLGARKPDASFFAQLLGRIGEPPDAVLFVDDRPVNVAGARAAGLRAVRFTGAADLRDRLADEGVPVASSAP